MLQSPSRELVTMLLYLLFANFLSLIQPRAMVQVGAGWRGARVGGWSPWLTIGAHFSGGGVSVNEKQSRCNTEYNSNINLAVIRSSCNSLLLCNNTKYNNLYIIGVGFRSCDMVCRR